MKRLVAVSTTLLLGTISISNALATTYSATTVSYLDYFGSSGTAAVGSFEISSPGVITWDVTSGGGTGIFNFEIAGFGSLDGQNNDEDDLTVYVDGVETFSGTFNLGGGGADVVYYNPSAASWTNSNPPGTGLTWAGGTLDVSGLSASLQNGDNTIQFVYSGANQGLADEGWGLNSASLVASAPVPEPQVVQLWLASLILLGAKGKKCLKI